MSKSPINAMWENYRKMVVAPNAPAVQIVETQRAFFAGAATLYEYIMRYGLDAGNDITENDLARMAEIDRELRAFGKAFDSEAFNQRGTA